MKRSQPALSVGFLYDDSLDKSDGVAQYVKTLGVWLGSQGHEVSYLVGETKIKNWSGGAVYSLAKNQSVIFNRNRLSIPLPASRRKIKHLVAVHHFDVLHVQIPYSPFMAKHVINAAGDETAIVGTFHIYPSAPWVSLGTRLLRIMLGRSLKKFDEVISVSQPAAQFATRTFHLNTAIIPNAVEIARFKIATRKNSISKNRIVFLGRLVERKGVMQMLQAFLSLSKSMPEVGLTIAGDGPLRGRVERFVKRHHLDNRVRVLGFINEDKKPSILADAGIACFPSLSGESFGIVLLEAMAAAAGVVVGGNNQGYASVLENTEEVLFDPNDTKQFATTLLRILTDKELANKLHKQQHDLVRQYDVNRVGPQVVEMYRRAIAKHSKTTHNQT